MIKTSATISHRKKEIAGKYQQLVNEHILNLKLGKTDRSLEIKDFALMMHLHPVHLSNTIKEVTGKSTCDIYEHALLNTAKELLVSSNMSIAQIAVQLTYDPSNFTKFFKQYTGITPKKFRQMHLAE
ncbi:MAG TPA: AraC family transcriptional regulator [Chitinophagaceae bacterium]|nr:AraC family transcriptional regulator [Chitinophagaceae bacterium]